MEKYFIITSLWTSKPNFFQLVMEKINQEQVSSAPLYHKYYTTHISKNYDFVMFLLDKHLVNILISGTQRIFGTAQYFMISISRSKRCYRFRCGVKFDPTSRAV